LEAREAQRQEKADRNAAELHSQLASKEEEANKNQAALEAQIERIEGMESAVVSLRRELDVSTEAAKAMASALNERIQSSGEEI
jgi:hypothetical protein